MMAEVTRPLTMSTTGLGATPPKKEEAQDLPAPEPDEVEVEEEGKLYVGNVAPPDLAEDDTWIKTPDVEEEDEELDDGETSTDEPVRMELTDFDPKTELWDNGPTVGDAVGWKEKYGDIYMTSINPEYHLIWRTMDRGDYRKLVKHMEELGNSNQHGPAELNMIQEELICSIALLAPKIEDYDKVIAGIPSLLSQQILDASSFVGMDVRGL